MNIHIGSNFDEWLKEEGILEEVEEKVKAKMTKPIIIDGVDVSECNRLNTFPMQYGCEAEICLTHFEQWGGEKEFCKDRPDCYYKQLQRLKAENEELKEELKQLHNGRTTEEIYTLFGKPIKYWEELQAKNEELRKIIEDNNPWTSCKNCNKDYRKALEDVREITEKYYLPDKKLLATGIEINPYGAIIEIQEKINEVLNG